MDSRKAFPSKFLRAVDLDGREARVTIAGTSIETVQDKRPLVLSFVGKDKRMILNKTNVNTLADITGSFDTDAWVGWRITLGTAKVTYQGKLVDGLRINPEPGSYAGPVGGPPRPAPRPQPTAARPAPAPVEEWDSGVQEPFDEIDPAAESDDEIPF